MNKVIIGLFISIGLIGCSKNDVEGPVTISYKTEETKTDSNSEKTEVIIQESSTTNGGTTLNSFGDITIHGSSNTIAIGKDSVSIVDGKGMLGGKELDMDLSKGFSISYTNEGMLINGQKPRFKDDKSSSSKVEIKLTGKEVKIPINAISVINSSYSIEQKCSEDGKNYLVIDEALKPYLAQGFENGTIRLKNGTYQLNGQPKIVLETQVLEKMDVERGDDVTLTCVSKNSFIGTNSAISNFTVKNIDNKEIRIENNGTGKIYLEGKNIDKLIANNSGVGSIHVNIPINDAIIENNGVGSVSLGHVKLLDAENSGIGTINAKKVDKVVRQVNSGIGSINF